MRLRSGSRSKFVFELTPLVDMVFILLVFFMLGAAFVKPVVRMTLPVLAEGIGSAQSKPIYITIDSVGTIFINKKKVDDSQFISVFKQLYQPNSDQNVVLRADKQVTYQQFLRIVFLLKKQGVEDIGLEHDIQTL